jgi:peptidoglycan/LPS O-acetylase OafA/YrhL
MLAYGALLVLGVLRLTRYRWLLVGLAAACWSVVLLSAVDVLEPGNYRLGGIRFGLMFLTGACLYAFRYSVPASGWMAGIAAAAVPLAGYLPDYRLVAAPALAYLVFWIGSRLRHPRWTRTTDLSFGLFLFGFPVQQTLLVLGWTSLQPLAFFAVSFLATAPFALLSWFAVERPAMDLKRRWDRREASRAPNVPAATSQPGMTVPR